MPKEAQIKAVVEEYLNCETSLSDFAVAREEAVIRYNHLLAVHNAKQKRYDIHSAAPVIAAFEEISDIEDETLEAKLKFKELGETIKGYIRALNGHPLDVHFMFDELNHRAGVHTFSLQNDELKTTHAPAS